MSGYRIQVFIGPYPLWAGQAPVEKFSHSSSYNWPSQERLTRPPAAQFVGAGEETMSFSGYMHPHEPHCGENDITLSILRGYANTGTPFMIVAGTGKIFGEFCITNVDYNGETLMDDLRPRRVSYTINLKRYGADK